jgi:ribosome-binding protein aMBF1 (putative translation factor)
MKKPAREKRPRRITDGVEILHRLFYQGRPKRLAELEEARLNASIAREIYDLRTKAGLTQKQLAGLVGTTDSVISRLEDADYQGHSLRMLQRISAALKHRLEVRFVPVRPRRRAIA